MTSSRAHRARATWVGPNGLGLGLVMLGAACISSDPGGPAPMCETSDDCDQASGEVCAEGVCYGDPPEGASFAALLVPPDGRADLAVTELALLDIARDGTIAGLDFAPSIVVHGRVLLACPALAGDYACGEAASIGAQISVTRVAGFDGGPEWGRQLVATAGVTPGGEAFSFRLPRDPGATYQVTITPEAPDVAMAGGGAGTSPAELAPPRQLTLTADEDQTVDWYLGEPSELKGMRGCVHNQLGNGAPFVGMRVTALGRWTQFGRLERASSLAVTDAEGCFELVIARKMLDVFDVVVAPAPAVTLPTLRLFGEVVPDPVEGDPLVHEIVPSLLMPNAASPVTFRLPVKAADSGGGLAAVIGADARFETVFDMPVQPEAPDRQVEVSYSVQVVTSGLETSEPGVAEVPLYPGEARANRVYRVSVVPPAGAEFASAWGAEVSVGTAGGTLASLLLGRRVALTGVVEAADGSPIGGAPIEVKLSSLFGWSVGDSQVASAAEALPLATTTTAEDGSFFLWLDRELLAAPAFYDFEIKPATYAAPRWSFDGIALSSGDAANLGTLRLPVASYARGLVRDPAGAPVPAAELRLYQLPDGLLCMKAPDLEPGECEPPATLRGAFASDDLGVVRPVLPDP